MGRQRFVGSSRNAIVKKGSKMMHFKLCIIMCFLFLWSSTDAITTGGGGIWRHRRSYSGNTLAKNMFEICQVCKRASKACARVKPPTTKDDELDDEDEEFLMRYKEAGRRN